MQGIENQAFSSGTTVVIDDKHFQKCRFEPYILMNGGGDYYRSDCKFINCQFRLIGPAQRTVKFLALWGNYQTRRTAETNDPAYANDSVRSFVSS